jgi:tRNA 5-methylaminomethyl-2-thiouridine biosynthesis bifunctional protein
MLTPAKLTFNETGEVFSETYGDVYHSAAGGPEQSRHVFLAGNGLPERWAEQDRFVIVETGFGLGLNFLSTWAAWLADPKRCRRLHFVSVEKHPFCAADLRIAHQQWPQFAALSAELLAQWPATLLPGVVRITLSGGQVVLTLGLGDATALLRQFDFGADAFYLDGFSPAQNPEIWDEGLCWAIARLARPGATLATWSVSGQLRENLAAHEFDVEKRPGFATKRHMLVARYRSRKPDRFTPPASRDALIIGAGVAGCATAAALAQRGWRITMVDQAGVAQGASGNHAGVLRPHPSVDENPLARLCRAGFQLATSTLAAMSQVDSGACGALHYARNADQASAQQKIAQRYLEHSDYLQSLDAETIRQKFGLCLQQPALWYPQARWVSPPSFCRALLAMAGEQLRFTKAQVQNVAQENGTWHAYDEHEQVIASASHLILASGYATNAMLPGQPLPLRAGRGQINLLDANEAPDIPLILCGMGYAIPSFKQLTVCGASLMMDRSEVTPTLEETRDNLQKLQEFFPEWLPTQDESTLAARVSIRPMSRDRLPIVGALPEHTTAANQPGRKGRQTQATTRWCISGFGSRGLVVANLMAELLASQIEQEPLPLENDLVKSVSPARFR